MLLTRDTTQDSRSLSVYVSDIMLFAWKLGCKITIFLLISKASFGLDVLSWLLKGIRISSLILHVSLKDVGLFHSRY